MTCIETSWRTQLPVHADPLFTLSANEPVLMLGSCFTDNIGARMADSGFDVCVNPGGVQYNPASIAMLLRAAMDGEIPRSTIFCSEGRTRSWLLPTRFSAVEPDVAVSVMQQAIDELRTALLRADVMIVTFGTSWIYRHKVSEISDYTQVVGNCHKVPAREFARCRMSVSEIAEIWTDLIEQMTAFRGTPLKLILTVSPIRHFKDGAHENTLSKSTLHLAVAQLASLFDNIRYFPAYELLMDDLRDYRFYAEDMVHPAPLAVDYIWTHFLHTFFTDADRSLIASRFKALRSSHHRQLLNP